MWENCIQGKWTEKKIKKYLIVSYVYFTDMDV